MMVMKDSSKGSSESFLDVHRRRQKEKEVRCDQILWAGGRHLKLDEDSIPWILNNIDFFVSQTRGDERLQSLTLDPNSLYDDDEDDFDWDKLGQA